MSESHPGFLICFTGIDGSGKTTQAMMLTNELKERGIEAVYVWNRGGSRWTKTFLKVGRFILQFPGEKGQKKEPFINPYDPKYVERKSKLFRFPFIKLLWEMATRLDHISRIRAEILPLLKLNKIVVCDRYIWDSTVDLAVTFNETEGWLKKRINKLTWNAVPDPDITFYIEISPEVAFARKEDIPNLEYVKKRAGFYQEICWLLEMCLIDGTSDINQIHRRIMGQINPLLERREGA
jgi:thymidylate kinase